MGVNFQVGGSHGKIYPWVFPGTARREIDGNTAQQVQKHFTGRFKRYYLEVVRQNGLVANHRLLHLTAIQTMHQYPLIHRLAACVTRAMKFLEVV